MANRLTSLSSPPGHLWPTNVLRFSSNRYNRIKHALIVAPTTLLINWRKEFKKWTNFELSINTIDGSVTKKTRLQMIKSVQAGKGILMTTYDMARNLKEDLSTFLGLEFKWDYIILGRLINGQFTSESI